MPARGFLACSKRALASRFTSESDASSTTKAPRTPGHFRDRPRRRPAAHRSAERLRVAVEPELHNVSPRRRPLAQSADWGHEPQGRTGRVEHSSRTRETKLPTATRLTSPATKTAGGTSMRSRTTPRRSTRKDGPTEGRPRRLARRARAPLSRAPVGERGGLRRRGGSSCYDRFDAEPIRASRRRSSLHWRSGPGRAMRLARAIRQRVVSGLVTTTLLAERSRPRRCGTSRPTPRRTTRRGSRTSPWTAPTSVRYDESPPRPLLQSHPGASLPPRDRRRLSERGSTANPWSSCADRRGDATGSAIDGEAYVFARGGPADHATRVAYGVPRTATHHIVCDLAPSSAYAISAAPEGGGGCRVVLTPGSGKVATANGVLAFDLSECALR